MNETSGDRRRRAVAGLGAAMLVAAAGGVGFGIGRSVDDGPAEVLSPASAEPATTEPATSDPSAPATEPEPVVEPAAEPAEEPGPGDDVAAGDVAFGDGDPMASGGYGGSWWGSEPLEVLAERVLPDGLTLRAQLASQWDDAGDWGIPGWQPAGWCFPSGDLRIALGGGGVIDAGSASWYREPANGRSVSWLTLGGVDGAPHRVVVAQVAAGTTAVEVVFADGAVDRAEPQAGIALLAVPGRFDEPWQLDEQQGGSAGFEIRFEQPDGDVTIAADAIGTFDSDVYRAECQPPPPALPAPGEQPADPAAAEQEIVDAMTRLYDSATPMDAELDLVDDPTGVLDALEQVADGGFAELAASVRADVRELVFTTPTEAWFRYDLVGALQDRFGVARLVDGRWRVVRATVCQDLGMAGGDCGPSDVPAYQPVGQPPVDPSAPIVVD